MTEQASATNFPPPRGCPYDAPDGHLARREAGPLTKVTLKTGQQAWVATRHADVRGLLTDPSFSANRADPNFPLLDRSPAAARRRAALADLDGPARARPARRAVVGEFTVRRLAALRPRIQQIVDDHIDAMLAGPRPADLVTRSRCRCRRW